MWLQREPPAYGSSFALATVCTACGLVARVEYANVRIRGLTTEKITRKRSCQINITDNSIGFGEGRTPLLTNGSDFFRQHMTYGGREPKPSTILGVFRQLLFNFYLVYTSSFEPSVAFTST